MRGIRIRHDIDTIATELQQCLNDRRNDVSITRPQTRVQQQNYYNIKYSIFLFVLHAR